MSSTATETITDPGEEVLPLDFIARQVFRMEMVSTERKLAGLVTRGQRLGAPHSVLLQIKGHKCDKDCPEPPELRRKVEKRCALAHAVFNAPEPNACSDILSAPGIVRMEDPPVEDGVMDCVMRVERIIDKDYSEGKKSKLASVPSLLWRIRSLLRTYTDGLIHARKSPDLAFCDFELLYDVAFPLHHIGMLLQLDPPRFQDLLTTCGLEMDLLVLDEPLDIGAARLMAMENESIEPFSVDTLADHFSQLEIAPSNQDAAEMGGRDIPAYATVLFYGNLLMAYLLLPPDTEDNKRRRAKAMSRIVQWSSSMVLPQVIKDALADCIRPIYWDQALCREFCLKGGLSAIVRHLVSGEYRDWGMI
ncbi:hypothetical protein SISSUDRAFT_1048025 [Sistotremastrum suecicum HHB10207 ss-3]|uniref:Uncharacterized protein n=1 Tax=Sistotremastrum suecicum HHB10207 ss-3 TaxID=1314776 RepID=A0A166CTX3_9AGAM|nr:hypothetical protein SISSUDRAFT_1048025 [Sistotremastrum suecicum HHB10207 ss-3]